MIKYQYNENMNTLLLLFALPVATIILAIVLQKILKCPLLVAATFFAIYLIVTYAVFDSSFLVYTILYTILAYVTAVLTRLICNILSRCNLCERKTNCICDNTNNISTVSNGTWSCCSRDNTARIGIANTNENIIGNNTETINEPVIVLTNRNNNSRRNNCCCSRR